MAITDEMLEAQAMELHLVPAEVYPDVVLVWPALVDLTQST